jgi:hypothetical protein
MMVGIGRLDRRRLAEQRDRFGAAPALLRQRAEQVQRRGVARLDREHVAIEPLGLVAMPGLMRPEGGRKHLRHRRGGGSGGFACGAAFFAVHAYRFAEIPRPAKRQGTAAVSERGILPERRS